ncbi:general transcription factor II-I repeat domain-containing protein 2A [Trichonephila clavipes]|nr:general transcription factor II-I repeat domain-containing protein 2A [Trichonephila clavipes]
MVMWRWYLYKPVTASRLVVGKVRLQSRKWLFGSLSAALAQISNEAAIIFSFKKKLGPKEELLGLLPLKGQMREEEIANTVIECMDKHHIPLDKIVSISTDGGQKYDRRKKRVCCYFERKNKSHEILVYHCIIHKEALCAQTFPNEICKVMELVITIINSILTKVLNHRQFKEFLFDMESEYADLLLHNKVRWLSRRNVLKRFVSLFPEIKEFLLEKGVHYPELTDDQWIQNFYVMGDITSHLNQFNRKLHWFAKIKDEVEKLAYQLNEEAERTERPIRRLSKVMYGSTCADMQVDVMGECLSSIKHVVGVRSVFLSKRLHAV